MSPKPTTKILPRLWQRSGYRPAFYSIITKHGNVLLQFTTARSITNYDSMLLQFAIGALVQFTTTVITIYDSYYKSRQLLLQFTTGATIHDVITIHDSTYQGCLFSVHKFPFKHEF